MKFREADINELFAAYRGKPIYYCPNPGNAGDAVIAYSTYSLLKKHGIPYQVVSTTDVVDDSIVLYGGGGNMRLVPGLTTTASMRFLTANIDQNREFIVLPHTINALPKVSRAASEKLRIICREKVSYRYVRKRISKKADVFLCNDMAFYLDLDGAETDGEGELNAFRTDMEKTSKALPHGNIDVSLRWEPREWVDEKEAEQVASEFISFLNGYRKINTNRLHVAIVGALLGKEVRFYPNNYYKNVSVYEYSMKNKFRNVTFVKKRERLAWVRPIFSLSRS